MHILNTKLLKLIYSGLLINTPSFISNPFNNNRIIAPLQVSPLSTYINFKLDTNQIQILNTYISKYNDNIEVST